MFSKKKIALSIVLNYLLCYGISFNPVAMDRSLSPGTIRTLCSFHRENNLNEIQDSIKTIDDEHGVRLYVFNGKPYILKQNGYEDHYQLEEIAYRRFQETTPLEGIYAPIYCKTFFDNNNNEKKYYVIYPYAKSVDKNVLFKFINYSDYSEKDPSKLRSFVKRKELWVNLINQLIEKTRHLYQDQKLLHHDWSENNVLFDIDKENDKLIVRLIDFDNVTNLKAESIDEYCFKEDLCCLCQCLIHDYLLPLFLPDEKSLTLDSLSSEYFKKVSSALKAMCSNICKNPPRTVKEYSSYVDNLVKVLIDGEMVYN